MKKVVGMLVSFTLLLQMGCGPAKDTLAIKPSFKEEGVSIIDRGNYFDVTLDYTTGLTPRRMGELFGKGILQMEPEYESLIDSYIAENINKNDYSGSFSRVEDLKPQLEQSYKEEIEGIASAFSGGSENKRADGKISLDELYLFNLFPDVARGTQCSFVSVFGESSETKSTVSARILDWYGGSRNQLPRVQGIVTIKYPGKRICSIGYMGYVGIITGLNDSKVFAAILDSQSGAPYSSEGRRSYPLDLRFALETKDTLDAAAEFMKEHSEEYTVNHILAFSDEKESKVLENNFSGAGTNGQEVRCALRSWDSELNDGVTWEMKDAVGSVNSFMLYGNKDNYSNDKCNTGRWENMKEELSKMGPTVTPDELKEVASFDGGSPGAFLDSGDLYNKMTLQIVVYQPESFELDVFFRPQESRKNPDKPVFEKIQIFN